MVQERVGCAVDEKPTDNEESTDSFDIECPCCLEIIKIESRFFKVKGEDVMDVYAYPSGEVRMVN